MDRNEEVARRPPSSSCYWPGVSKIGMKTAARLLNAYGDLAAVMADALQLARRLGHPVSDLNVGGGLGIRYDDETPPSRAALLNAVFERLDRHPRGAQYEILFEFGRSIVGNAGVLLTRVEYLKRNGERNFAIVDAGMNDLMRPALYEAWHGVQAVSPRQGEAQTFDIVGPVCESGDWLARARRLCLAEGDLLAVMSAGAYGMAMSSNYNKIGRAHV